MQELPSFVFWPVIVKLLTLIKSLREYGRQNIGAFFFIQWKNTDQYHMIYILYRLYIKGRLWLDNLRPDLLNSPYEK